jgi:small redox-active disulfide protein 2
MKIEILGTGCPKCTRLFENTKQAVLESNLEAEVLKVQDINEITNFGVMITPALAVNGEVKSTGKLLSPDEIKKLLT